MNIFLTGTDNDSENGDYFQKSDILKDLQNSLFVVHEINSDVTSDESGNYSNIIL